MDVKINCSLEVIACILFELGFSLDRKRNYTSAIRRTKCGRMHVLIKQMNKEQVFCEIHYDSKIHFLFLGVDYDIEPATFFKSELKEKLEQAGIKSNILNGRSWFTRKNKAWFTGMRL